MKNLFFLFCICFVIFSCKKKEIPVPIDYTYNFTEPVNNPLTNLLLDCSSNQFQFINSQQYIYSRPMFNPTNPNEIAYLRRLNGENECSSELWTFNFNTGRTNKVTSKTVCNMDWSILNWIVFISDNNEVWKIKSNGNESQRLLSNNFFTLVKINPQGNQILTNAPSTISFGTEKKLIDFDGNTIQKLTTIDFEYMVEMDWFADKIIFPNSHHMRLYDMNQDTVIKIETLETQQFSGMNNIQFLNNNEVLFLLERSMHKMNLDTGEKTPIKENGYNDWFYHFDISLDRKTILMEKQDFFKLSECTVQVRNYIAFMDIDGTNERRILIPE